MPKQLIPYFNIDHRKILRHRRVEAGHDHVIVVHLAGVRNYRHRMRFGEGGNFAGLRDAADTVGIELDVIERMSLQQLTKSVKGKLVFASGDRNAPIGFQFRVTENVIGDYRLLQPSQPKRFQQRQHSLGVLEGPAHISIRHHIDALADGLTNGSDQGKIALHARRSICGSPAEAKFHGLIALRLVALSFCF